MINETPPKEVLNGITSERIMSHVKPLSSDEYEGRAPGTHGEDLSVKYIESQLKQTGVGPGNPDGTYIQGVPLVGTSVNKNTQLNFTAGNKEMHLSYADEFVARSRRITPKISIDTDVVFVGYGVVAPEYNWDDYKDVDVRGKVILMLVGDPPVPDPNDPSKLDPKVFGGQAMTYYGRWTYKFDIASEKGAAGALIVHETGTAGYPWDVVKNSWSNEQFDIVAKDNNMSKVPVQGLITEGRARELMAACGKNFDTLKKSAIQRNFKPVQLGAKAAITFQTKIRLIESHNVLAKLDGSDPVLKKEYVIYMAHWDHLGVGLPDEKGDKIYHGALDNATGVGGLIELARAFKSLLKAPKRSILFLSVTAEESGLLGSQYYAENPPYPLNKTVAAINMDGLNIMGRTRDITVIGLGYSTLDDVLRKAAAEQGRVLKPDAEPEKGFYYRSDHFNFAKAGVPALNTDSGIDYIGRPAGWGLQKRDEYTRLHYHQPSDKITPDWNLSGALEDLRLLMITGYRIANSSNFPEWKPGTEFKARRDEMMRKSSE